MFERHIEHRESLSLEAKAVELLAGLRIDASGKPQADIYPTDNRFNRPAGGLYWQVSTPKGSVHSSSLWDQSLSQVTSAPSDGWATRRADGPYGHGLLLIERLVRPDPTKRPVLVQLATDDDALLQARREFSWELLGSLALLWAVLVLAAYAQVGLGLRPLLRVRKEIERLRRNPGARLSTEHAVEIRPLIDAINGLAEARAADLSRARSRAADLAHSLKTPLAALAAQSRRAREAGAIDAADGLDRAIAAAGAALEAELARARSAIARETNRGATSRALDVVESVVSVLERTDAGERIVFEIAVPAGLEVPVAASDLTEILGALIENAVRHARRQVRIHGESAADRIMLSVNDDGPGLAGSRAELAITRGARLDESGPGHGFGLAIAKDHVEATDGIFAFATGALDGLEVRVSWATRRSGTHRA
ncbi:sensor histidine kinase [Sphingomonas sp. JC676]|nr:sensor histidine kinase [Sphingomonas sp. JC676]